MKPVVIKISELAESIKRRQQNKFDVTICIDGARGSGKSTLAWKLLTKTGNYKPERDMMFTPEDVIEGITSRKFGIVHADEMITSAHNRDFFSTDNKVLVKAINRLRYKFNILVGCVPYFYDIDTQIRKNIKIRITVVRRGVAIVQVAKSTLYANDPWETSTNKKIEESWQDKKTLKTIRTKYHRLTTYAGHLFFTPLKPASQEKYDRLKEAKSKVLNVGLDSKKTKDYWEEANELIETERIKGFKELKYWLMGKGILYSRGKNKIINFRKDLGYELTLKDKFLSHKKKGIVEDEEEIENKEQSMKELLSRRRPKQEMVSPPQE